MALSYPTGLSSEFLMPVVRAAAEGEFKYRSALASRSPIPNLRAFETEFVAEVAAAFMQSACSATQTDSYTPDRILADVDDQIRRMLVFLEYDFQVNGPGYRVDDLREDVKRSPKYLLALSSVTKIISERTHPDNEGARRSAARRAFVEPRLKNKGWTPSRLATKAGVAKSVVIDFLNGKTLTLQERNRRDLAQALGVRPEQFPL